MCAEKRETLFILSLGEFRPFLRLSDPSTLFLRALFDSRNHHVIIYECLYKSCLALHARNPKGS
jgi:hypothetical protein